jgi:hypothetical protein
MQMANDRTTTASIGQLIRPALILLFTGLHVGPLNHARKRNEWLLEF